MKLLTTEQANQIKSEMVQTSDKSAVVVRFMENSLTLANLTTGQFHSKGVNTIHLTHFWNFTEETAKKIADLTGLTAVISKPERKTAIKYIPSAIEV